MTQGVVLVAIVVVAVGGAVMVDDDVVVDVVVILEVELVVVAVDVEVVMVVVNGTSLQDSEIPTTSTEPAKRFNPKHLNSEVVTLMKMPMHGEDWVHILWQKQRNELCEIDVRELEKLKTIVSELNWYLNPPKLVDE